MYFGEDTNSYGTPITLFKCEVCGGKFSVCPAQKPENHDQWKGCLAEQCDSYDPKRDADIPFMSKQEIAKEKKVVSLEMLKAALYKT